MFITCAAVVVNSKMKRCTFASSVPRVCASFVWHKTKSRHSFADFALIPNRYPKLNRAKTNAADILNAQFVSQCSKSLSANNQEVKKPITTCVIFVNGTHAQMAWNHQVLMDFCRNSHFTRENIASPHIKKCIHVCWKFWNGSLKKLRYKKRQKWEPKREIHPMQSSPRTKTDKSLHLRSSINNKNCFKKRLMAINSNCFLKYTQSSRLSNKWIKILHQVNKTLTHQGVRQYLWFLRQRTLWCHPQRRVSLEIKSSQWALPMQEVKSLMIWLLQRETSFKLQIIEGLWLSHKLQRQELVFH